MADFLARKRKNHRKNAVVRLPRHGALPVPPAFAVVEDPALARLTLRLLKERYLVTDSELHIFCDMEMGLRTCLKIHIVPYAAFQTEADIMEGLIGTCSVILVKERAFAIAIERMVVIIIVTRRVEEIESPVDNRRNRTELEFVVHGQTGAYLVNV